MKFGIIGTGNMGSLIVDALIKSKSAKPKQLNITNRTEGKALALQEKYPGISVFATPDDVIRRSAIVFICVKPQQFFPLLQSVRGLWHYDQIAISITSPITINQLELLIPCQVARVVPSIVNQSLAGSTLVTFGTQLTDYQKFKIWNLVGRFSRPIEISEEKIRAASDISSCGPAFLSFGLEKVIEAAAAITPLSTKEATALISEMIIGFGKLLEDKTYSLAELKQKVTVKGGVTGVGLDVLAQYDQRVFEQLFIETQKKFVEDHQKIDPMYRAEE
ncbi:late competence protein ComER [Sporolactobacillus spathodeae]|uniref:Competence protein ComER n=1 Tax=Sporolactobacillus spathodeae TaxID=1465502 RepID=A0ABS2Q7T6_9BACL|nr:late competence protein ComER [Sporolactobacillus spathodeae]MBM7657365.1 competence protein ComER [Sporolactobacillus spathodeae]